MKLRLALAAATCLAVPMMAHAQPVTGPYISLGAGTTLQNHIHYNDTTLGGIAGGKVQFKPSYSGEFAVGYGLGNGFRIELAGNFNRNTASTLKGYNGTEDKATGGLRTYGPMVNALYDFNVGMPIYPFVGAGIGYQFQDIDSAIRSDNGAYFHGTKGRFAYNVIAGASYPIAAVPGLSFTATYKFMQRVGNPNYDGVQMGLSYSNTFLLGLRYQLFQPVAAPVPAPAPVAPVVAPAPAVAKTFLVFFDWDKYNLTPRATQIIAQAADYSKTAKVTTLDVNGYTDTSGAAGYNMGLSIRRAKSVAAQLVVDGVPADEIEIHGYGETHLLVQTGPGVREPQNRRVEIILH